MNVEFKPKAIKDLRDIPRADARRIAERLKSFEQGLSGDVKRLTNFTPEYRLRVGSYRVLFEIEESTVVVYRVVHRQHAYAKR
jgi:mRNA interferase RelE/StbE